MSSFAHLHLYSQYSLLNGAIRLSDLCKRTKAMGMSSVAVTDQGNMFGAVDFFKRARKEGINPIIGFEAPLRHDLVDDKATAGNNIVLLARDSGGYANLRELISHAWLEEFHRDRPQITLSLLERYRRGIIALSGGRDGVITSALRQDRWSDAVELSTHLRDLMGPESFYLEVLPGHATADTQVQQQLRSINTQLNVPLVATNQCQYLERKDARAHEVLQCIGSGYSLDDYRRPQQSDDSAWLKPGEVMWDELQGDFSDALKNSVKIAEACKVEIDLGKVYLPQFKVPKEHDTDTFLALCAKEGLQRRFIEFEAVGKTIDSNDYFERLDEELEIIKSMGFPGYFLIVQDFINWAKDRDIPVGPGRGSGAGSLVAYALRITDLDPLPYGLLFERFLNPERVSMPDFDIDFCMNRRGEVIDYVTEKYGQNNVGQIATFGGLKARGVIKDVGRVLGLTFGETDRLSKMVPEVLGITLEQALEQEPRLRQSCDEDDRIRDLMDIALNLEGLLKSTGMHAAGVVIGDQPLWKYCPVFTGANDELVTQFAKDEVEEAGLVKFDFLGLKTLTVIDEAVRMVNRGRGKHEKLDLNAQSLDDTAVYKLISKGETEGVFQLESSGFQELLKKLKPDKFEDIVAAVALYRPGPLNSGMLDDFIARKHGRQRISYPHESLADVLQETYGVIVYQEQVMQIAQAMAGFTLGAADLLRRAMGKKKLDVMAAQREVFKTGAKERGVAEKTASEIFDLMEKFAEYGFNKSHSAAYALLTFQTAYLKAHHPIEFMAALLTNDRDNADKVAKGIRHARQMGIEVMPPCINLSGVNFESVDGRLLFGMGGLKGVGTSSVEAIVEARTSNGPFTSLFDFCERVDLKRINKKTIEALNNAGAFDLFDHPRARIEAGLDIALERAQSTQRDKASGQSSLFGMLSSPNVSDEDDEFPSDILKVSEWPEQILLAREKLSLGVYVSGHPLDRFINLIERHGNATVDSLPRKEPYEPVIIGGIQTGIRVRPFKNGKGRMAIVQFEDLTGSVEVVAMGDDFDRYEALLTSDDPVLLRGTVRVNRDGDQTKVSLRLGVGRRQRSNDDGPYVVSLHEIRATRTRGFDLSIDARVLSEQRVKRLAALMRQPEHKGQCAVRITVKTNGDDGDCLVVLDPGTSIKPSDELSYAVQQIFEGECELRVH